MPANLQKLKTQKIPKLRFPGFSGAWEEKRLGDCLDYEQPTKYIVRSTEYDDSYSTPVLTAGKSFILGYTNETDNIFSDKLPVIIFDDFTTTTQFVDFPFKVKSSAMKILNTKNNYNIRFLFETLQKIRYEIGGHGRHWISKYSNIKVFIPGLKEQQKVSEFVGAVDEWIVNLRKQKEFFELYKKAIMQKIFSQEIRFKDEKGKEFPDWQVDKLGDIGDLKNGYTFKSGNYKNNGRYKIVTIGNVQNGILELKETNQIDTLPIDIQKHQILNIFDILVSMTGNVGRVCLVNQEDCLLNQRVGKIVLDKRAADVSFIFQRLNTREFEYKMHALAQGGAQGNISKGDISNFQLLLPSVSEQKKIAEFLTSVDNIIESKQQQIIQAGELKKGLMQKLFV